MSEDPDKVRSGTESPPRYPWSDAELREVAEDGSGDLRKIVGLAGRRFGLSADEIDEFHGDVVLKLLDRDFARLRAFSGRSSLRTYLMTVVSNLLRDHRNHLWGKYRPSKAAVRHGATAILLDKMIRRDRRTVDEAIETLVTRPDVSESRPELRMIAEQLPERVERRTDSGAEELLIAFPDASDSSARQRRGELLERSTSLADALHRAIAQLEPDDRLLVRLRWFEGQTVARVARLRELDQQKLYRRYETVLRHLRRALAAAGLAEQEVVELLRSDEDLQLDGGGTAQKAAEVRPSNEPASRGSAPPKAENSP